MISVLIMLYMLTTCLMALIAAVMQYLLDICYEYGKENDILFKYNCIVFKPRRYHLYCPVVTTGSEILQCVHDTKYLQTSLL